MMYDKNNPKNKVSLLLISNFCGLDCSRENINLRTTLKTDNTEKTNVKIYTVSKLLILYSFSSIQNFTS